MSWVLGAAQKEDDCSGSSLSLSIMNRNHGAAAAAHSHQIVWPVPSFQKYLLNIRGETTVVGPPASWNSVFLAKISQDHLYISPGTIQNAQKRPRGPLPGAFSFLIFFPKNPKFYKICHHPLIFGPTIKCYTISESSCLPRRRAILVINLVASTNEK